VNEETWEVKLGDRTFKAPRLPFRISRVVYPLCQKLTNAKLTERIYGTFENSVFVPPPPLEVTDEEMEQLAKVALLTCQAADQTLTEAEFNDMPITPAQLFDAFIEARKACGGWRASEGKNESGEVMGTDEPPT